MSKSQMKALEENAMLRRRVREQDAELEELRKEKEECRNELNLLRERVEKLETSAEMYADGTLHS